jgi:hypothetical protein
VEEIGSRRAKKKKLHRSMFFWSFLSVLLAKLVYYES